MANFLSKELAEDYRRYPIDDHGKIRYAFWSFKAPAGGLAANDTINVLYMPANRIRVLPSMSRIEHSALGTGRTLDLGHREYLNRPVKQPPQAENGTVFINGKSVAAAGNDVKWSDVLKYDLYSQNGITFFATIKGGTMPADATLNGYVAYIYE